jgi:lamin tail-like protein
MVRRAAWRWLAIGVPIVAACAQVIGADFDGLRPQEMGSGGGGAGGPGSSGAGGMGPGSGGDSVAIGAGGFMTGGSAGATGGGGGARDAGLDGAADGGDARVDVEPDRSGDGEIDATKDERLPDAPHDGSDALLIDVAIDPPVVGGVVINELNAQGALEDYIELYNPRLTTFDLSQYSIAQGAGAAMPPDTASFLTFASGTTLDPGAFLLIVANQLPPRGGPHDPCAVPGFPSIPCYYVDWGISRNGERVYLLDPNNAPVQVVDFPVPDAGQPASGRSYGRFPDGFGDFQSTVWTPGAANQLQ